MMLLESPIPVTAGASGAIFGLLGAQAVILVKLRRSATPVLVIVALNIVISISIPGISLWGHTGGLVAGALATAGILFLPGSMRSPRIGWAAVAAVAALALAIIGVRVLDLRAQMGV